MIVIAANLVLSAFNALTADNPIIGWHNLVTVSNVRADTEEDDHPATELANPATHLFWRAADDSAQHVTVEVNTIDDIDYVAVARHNFGSANIPVSIDGATAVDPYQKIMLHFDGTDVSTTITDDNSGGSAHTWTAGGNAAIDTADSKFGGASGLFDGTGDYFTTADHADFTLGSGEWTCDFWFKIGAGAGSGQLLLCGQGNSSATATSISFFIERSATSNVITANTFVGGSAVANVGTTVFTNVVNTGWHHVALVRSANTMMLFIDGVKEGGNQAIAGSVNNSTNSFSVGRLGELTSSTWNGWIDEFRLSVGVARWTANFTPPVQAYDQWVWSEIVEQRILADDTPVLFRYAPQSLAAIRLTLDEGDEPPQAAVLYVGALLVLDRSIKINEPHMPFPMGIVSKEINGKSESGNFLGRIEINRFNQSSAAFEWFDPVWYRENFQPFVVARPSFFFAWNPTEYPTEVGYAWLTDNPLPEVDPVTRRIAIDLKMQGIVD